MPKTTKSKMSGKTMVVDPSLASQWLGQNAERQRKVSGDSVRDLSYKMKNGLYLSGSPDPIIFDINGELIQGQHRLLALCDANHTTEMFVIVDAPPESFAILDQSRRRTAAHFIRLPHARLVISSAKILWQVEHHLAHNEYSVSTDTWNHQTIAKHLDQVDAWPELAHWVSLVATSVKTGNNKRSSAVMQISPRFILAVVCMASRVDGVEDEKIASFLAGFKYGVGEGGEFDPRRICNARFTSDTSDYLLSNAGTDQGYALVVKTWNAWVAGEKIKMLKTNDGDRRPAITGFMPPEEEAKEPLLPIRPKKKTVWVNVRDVDTDDLD